MKINDCWPLWALLGGILEASWGIVGVWEASRGALGAILGVFERPLGVSGPSWRVFGFSWRFLVAFCGPQGPPKGLHTHICGPGAGPGPLGPVPRYMYICGHDVSPYRS